MTRRVPKEVLASGSLDALHDALGWPPPTDEEREQWAEIQEKHADGEGVRFDVYLGRLAMRGDVALVARALSSVTDDEYSFVLASVDARTRAALERAMLQIPYDAQRALLARDGLSESERQHAEESIAEMERQAAEVGIDLRPGKS